MKLSASIFRMRAFAPLLLVLISATLATAAYLQALDYPFIYDDRTYITENTKLAGLHLTELWRLFVEPYNGFSEFLPLRDLSYWLDMSLFGMNPSAFRVHNILLYLLCLPLVYATTLGLWRYFRPADAASAPLAAAAVTALFALHPTLVESVVWISGRKYMLPNLFSLLTLWFAVSARREQGLSIAYASAALVAFVAVMLSKATYVPLAPIIALLWVIFWRDIPAPERRRSTLLWPLSILLLAAFLTRIFIGWGTAADKIPLYFGIETVTRTLAVLGWLARLAVSPESRHYFYPVLEGTWLPGMVILGGVILASAAGGVVMLLRQRSLEGFALVAFALLCLPYLQLIPYAAPSLVSDRFLSLAVWPAALLLVALAWGLKPLPRAVLLLFIALPWVFQTVERPRDWRNFEAHLEPDFRAYPGYYMPVSQKIMGTLLPQGLNRDASELASGITSPEIRNLMLELVHADYAVRVIAESTGNPQEAMALLTRLGIMLNQPPAQTKWNPPMSNIWQRSKSSLAYQWNYLAKHFIDDASVRYNAGLWMLNVPKYEDAVIHLRAAVDSQRLPESERGTAFKNLGLALLKSGHAAEAEAPLRAALEQPQPDMQAYCVLSKVYEETKQVEEAMRAEARCPKLASGEKAAP